MVASHAETTPGAQARGYFAERRLMVDRFVGRHLGIRGTIRLHGAALGWDLVRAPVNVALSPVLVLTRLAAWLLRRARLPALAAWLGRRRILLRTDVSARVEAAILAELLEVPLAGAEGRGGEALSDAIVAAPRFREIVGIDGDAEARALADRLMGSIAEYAGTRSAVAEFTTALVTLAVGAIAFQALTPGMISMAPGLAGAMSHSAAVAGFPLGEALGGIWYGIFPVGPSPWMVGGTVAGLVVVGAMFAAFAGLVADPVQARLGIHRRRLLRLIDTLEAETTGFSHRPFVAREHFVVRMFDLWDAALSLLRVFRS